MFRTIICIFIFARSLLISLDYSNLELFDGHRIHVMEVDPTEHHIMLVHNPELETVLQTSRRKGAVAGINGGFFSSGGGAASALMIYGQWFGFQNKLRGAVGWSEEGNQIMGRLVTNVSDRGIEVLGDEGDSYDWDSMDYVLGGAPLIIKSGEVIDDISIEGTRESFFFGRHPRTAVGFKEDGTWVFVVVDGRNWGRFKGMTIPELAKTMVRLGCTHALNLDGGGSSTMVLDDEVINHPAGETSEEGKWVRAVGSSIMILGGPE